MSELKPIKLLAERLDWDVPQLRRCMWNHGFDPVIGEAGGAYYRVVDFEQMVQERLRWGFLVDCGPLGYRTDRDPRPRRRCEPAAPYEAPICSEPLADRWNFDQKKFEANEALNRRLREQLANAPVLAKDIDYLATRGQERRPKHARGVGPTEILLQQTKAKK